ncbi:uncharacterized protein I303_102314 [Kwoniella dejecticola CBS 10117]|uniref:Peptidase of plants and bacteria-domain-containing protein n=1 Tax=Kwoniella dejecticola CBS 10117 TaxID=1296121 RepID=A0A1A6ABB5_9TREE|nr:uncharacterized protein I303_01545 [Kwoniella dejecticola CBS 10117]OBR87343.1 hypothetical protein I303_01545 [Kwoniella dejecticola CBS 10117]
MPSIPSFSFLKPRSKPNSPQPVTTYYLSSPSSPVSTSSSAQHHYHSHYPLRPIPPPEGPQAIPRHTLIFSFTHPHPSTSDATAFFLECIPDPIGFLYHSASFISRFLILNEHPGNPRDPGKIEPDIEWRHQLIALELEDKDGLAATSGGRIGVSLKWVEGVFKDVKNGVRSIESATKEFKGVLLHELVHTIQHDGCSTTPGWLIESIADYVRLQARLGPDHWRKSGSGRPDKGWEDGYDIGAKFLQWLVGIDDIEAQIHGERLDVVQAIPTQEALTPTPTLFINPTSRLTPTPTSTSAEIPPPAQPTQYPPFPDTDTDPDAIEDDSKPPIIPPSTSTDRPKRPGPFPDLVRLLDSRLKYERWHDSWWREFTGLGLDELWKDYLRYYGR